MKNPFVSRDLVDADCEGKYSFDGAFCSTCIYGDSKVFAGYLARLEKLKSKERS